MIRSLFAGVTGMKNHQIRMDVIGNNISNVNTVGFKGGRANFQDTFYQVLKSGGVSTNPAQVGLGLGLAGIGNNMNPGGLMSTARTLDLGINGGGFFKVIDSVSGKEYYTRDGVFYIDQNGYVVNSDGYRLVGELRNITAVRSREKDSRIRYDDTPTPPPTTTLTLQGTRADGTLGVRTDFTIDTAQRADINAGDNYTIFDGSETLNTFGFGNGDVITVSYVNKYGTGANLSHNIDIANAGTMTLNDLKSSFDALFGGGKVEMYFTDGGTEGTPPLTGNGDEGFGFRTIDCGPGVSLSISCKQSDGTPRDAFTGNNTEFVGGYARENGTGDDVDTIISKINAQSSEVGVVASKDAENRLILRTVSTEMDAVLEIGGGAVADPTYLGLSAEIFKNPGNRTTGYMQILNGPPATLNIDNKGVISGTDSNGNILEWEDGAATATDADFAQINLYTFANQDGLQRVNKNLFTESVSSGGAKTGKPGDAGYGTIASGYLEMSNVDLTDEFTSMITTQRGYQANARIITVSDTMLEELINLKR